MTKIRPIFTLFMLLILSWSTLSYAQSPVLVEASWLKKEMAKPNNNIVLIDVSNSAQYQKFHLPHAIFVNYNWLIKPQDGLALSGGQNYMVKLLSKLGIKATDHVVIYDNEGNLNASRLYWELSKLKHQKVSMLNGGSIAWVLAGYPVTQKPAHLKPSKYFANKHNAQDALTADTQEVHAAIKNPKVILLDARSKQEYFGNPKDKKHPSGHIPGALFFPWEVSVDSTNGYRQQSNARLNEFFNYLKLQNKNTPIIAYCNSGHRAARVFTMLKSQGFKNVKLYDGSMQEWSLSKQNPLKKGKQP